MKTRVMVEEAVLQQITASLSCLIWAGISICACQENAAVDGDQGNEAE